MYRLLIILAVLLGGPLAQAAPKPALTVMIVVDQLSAEYLDQRAAVLSGGVARLMQEGVVYRDARFSAAPTVTACGHAALATGAYGSVNGIAGNDWFDRSRGVLEYALVDSAYKVLGRAPMPRDGTSPAGLLAPALADVFRAFDGESKVIAVSLKDRAAISLGGHRPTAAVWLDRHTGRFTTSDYYGDRRPPWVEGENRALAEIQKEGFTWERTRASAGLAASERFPHRIAPEPKAEQFSRKLLTTPEADRHLLKLARAAVEAEGLGADDHPDFLAISLSGNDYLLHRYGGGTAEAAESLAAIDAELGGFLAFLEKKMKRDRLVVALVADHGSITPGEAKRLGLRAGHVHPEELKAHLETTLSDKLGKKQPWVQAITDAGIYLLEDAAIDFERVKVIAAEALLREEGVAEVYRRGHLEDWLGTAAGRAALRGYNQKTGGDLVVSLVPSWVWDDEVASHGSPYAYDTRVPMMIRAPGRGAQRVSRRVDPIDLPGTLAALNGMPPPGASEGELLHEAVLR